MTKPKSFKKIVVGIDEVGRGPLAGPVAVGAFIFTDNKASKLFKNAKESKQLSELQREEWFKKIKKAQRESHIDFVVIFKSEKIIDERGISFAIRQALSDALKRLKIKPVNSKILLDGGLKAPAEYKNQKTIIKGDTKEITIALASICAKVLRDRKMIKLAKKYNGYGLDVHKGYGTKKHREMILKNGLSDIHRKSFCKMIT